MRYLLLLFWLVPAFTVAQQADLVDFVTIKATVEPVFSSESVTGTVKTTFKMLQASDSVYLDGIRMRVLETALEGVKVTSSEKKIWFTGNFEANREYTAFFKYEAAPKQALYFAGNQVWTQGQGKYTSHWLPSLDDMNDKVEFDLTIVAPIGINVMANGKLVAKQENDGKIYFEFDMKLPMSSYLVAFAMGDLVRTDHNSRSGVPLMHYILAKDEAKREPTYRYTQEIFDFLETEIGVPYPWQNYKQAPVRDFLYAGMENTSATIFSEAFVVDSIAFNDRNYINVNAHELAHQWFGNLVTETSGTHHWLQEGFATYYAMLAEKEIFGVDHYYWKLMQSAEQLEARSAEGKGESLLNPKASSLTFYEKGAWALHMLKELIGEQSFKVAVKNYLEKHQFKNVTTEDFLREVRAATPISIDSWEADWLVQTAFKAKQAFESLVKNEFINEYFRTSSLRGIPIEEKKEELKYLLTDPNDYLGQEVVYQLALEPLEKTEDLYKLAFESDNLYVRQAIALTMEEVPRSLLASYESLLDDSSYVSLEAALPTLWRYFPENRSKYLDKLKNTVGFQNKNIRQLWLVLAMNTDNYQLDNRQSYIDELKNYSSSTYSFEIRQLALEFINELQLYDTGVLKNLVNASVHHNWRFRNFARSILDTLLQNSIQREKLAKILPELPEKEKKYLNGKLIAE